VRGRGDGGERSWPYAILLISAREEEVLRWGLDDMHGDVDAVVRGGQERTLDREVHLA
jgi:hypothetical protein